MADFSKITVKNFDKIREQFKGYVASKLYPEIIIDSQKIILPKLKNLLAEVFAETIFFRGIKGDYRGDSVFDAQAVLGMIEPFAEDSIFQMTDAIQESLELGFIEGIGPRGNNLTFARSVRLRYNFSLRDLEENLLAIKNSEYFSSDAQGKSHLIKWLEWAITGISDVEASLVYDDGGKFEEYSRSGRAIMQNKGSPWSISDHNNFSNNTNFIEEALSDQRWIVDSEKIVLDGLIESINNYV